MHLPIPEGLCISMLSQNTPDFFQAVLALTNEAECAQFFKTILSNSELEQVKNRWSIFLLLHDQLPHRVISARLGVGIATVSRGSEVYRHADGVRVLIDRLKERQGKDSWINTG
jgi:TrpR family trp operon transcriptional repressor